jgi:hypothetical protein
MLISPVQYPKIDGPLVFLAGPIQGSANWQLGAVHYLHQLDPKLHIANPRRDYLSGEFVYDEQVDWETHHLCRAGECGVILFWLACETEHSCDRAYAQTTRFELAEWKVRHERDGSRLVVGIDATFTGAKYIKRRFAQDCPRIVVCSTLEETCRIAAAACSET